MESKKEPVLQKIKTVLQKVRVYLSYKIKIKIKKAEGLSPPPILQNYPSIWCEDHTFQVAFLIIVTSNFIE